MVFYIVVSQGCTSFSFSGDEIEEGDTTDGWEEEDAGEPEVQCFGFDILVLHLHFSFKVYVVIDVSYRFGQIGDGGDGGGVVFQGVPWGERALSIACEVLTQFEDNVKLFSFKTTPRGYVYVRLDKLSNE